MPVSRIPKSSLWSRHRLLSAIAFARRYHPERFKGGVLMLSRTQCVKFGTLRNPWEASTMDFIRSNTSIPVPKVYGAFSNAGKMYIHMERIEGEQLAAVWHLKSAQSKRKILDQLKRMVDELRALESPHGDHIANVDDGPLYDQRVPGGPRFGPFRDVHAFHQHLRNDVEVAPTKGELEPAVKEANELIQWQKQDFGRIVFTHGDLSSLNIIVRGDEIVGIIDWETAGWYPYYWEYSTACYVNPQNLFWQYEIDKFLEPLPKELEMEKLRHKYFGDY